MSFDKDVVFELHKLILEQTNDLWLIATGLIAVQALLVAHVIRSGRVPFRQSIVAWFLSASVVLNAFSLMFGYFAKGALIKSMIEFAKKGQWAFEDMAKVMNFLQVACVTAGVVIFVIAFVFYSRELARAMVKGLGR